MASDSLLRPTALDPEALLTEIDAGDFLKLSVRTLQAWRSQGRGPAFVKAGRAIRYARADLLRWISASTVTNPVAAADASAR